MAKDILKLARGNKTDLSLVPYEPGYVVNESPDGELYIGTDSGPKKLTKNLEVQKLITDLGNKEQLNTHDRSSLVNAINEIGTQLAEKANESDVRKKSVPIGLNDASPELLAAIQGGKGQVLILSPFLET